MFCPREKRGLDVWPAPRAEDNNLIVIFRNHEWQRIPLDLRLDFAAAKLAVRVARQIDRPVALIKVVVDLNVVNRRIAHRAQVRWRISDGPTFRADLVHRDVVVRRPPRRPIGREIHRRHDASQHQPCQPALLRRDQRDQNDRDDCHADHGRKVRDGKQAEGNCPQQAAAKIPAISAKRRKLAKDLPDLLAQGDKHDCIGREDRDEDNVAEHLRVLWREAPFGAASRRQHVSAHEQ